MKITSENYENNWWFQNKDYIYITMVVVYCCLEREHYKVLKVHWNNSFDFKISTALQ